MGHHINTGGALILTFLSIGVGALLITLGNIRMNDVQGTSGVAANNDKLNSAKTYSLWAYILGWISAGLALILSFLYFMHMDVIKSLGTETPHALIFGLIAILAIISGILALVAYSQFRDANVTDEMSIPTYLWVGALFMGIGLLVILVTGVWRTYHISDPINACEALGTPIEVCKRNARLKAQQLAHERHGDLRQDVARYPTSPVYSQSPRRRQRMPVPSQSIPVPPRSIPVPVGEEPTTVITKQSRVNTSVTHQDSAGNLTTRSMSTDLEPQHAVISHSVEADAVAHHLAPVTYTEPQYMEQRQQYVEQRPQYVEQQQAPVRYVEQRPVTPRQGYTPLNYAPPYGVTGFSN